MAIFQGVLFLILGVGLLVIDYQSLGKGWLPCGPKGFNGRLEFRRDTHAVRYWLMFVMYGVAGLWMTVFAIRVLIGHAEPMPWQ